MIPLMKLLPPLHPDRRSSQEQIHPPPSYGVALSREWRRLLARPRDFALATWVPLVAMLLLGALVSVLPASELRVAVVDDDASSVSRLLLRRLDAGPELRLTLLDTPARAAAEVSAGRAQAALRVPAGFGAQFAAQFGAPSPGVAATSRAGAPGQSLPGSADAARLDLRFAPQVRAGDARVLQHVHAVLDHLAQDTEALSGTEGVLPGRTAHRAPALTGSADGGQGTGQAATPGVGAGAGPGAGGAPGAVAGAVAGATQAAAATRNTRAALPPALAAPAAGLALHVDAPALQARADALVTGSAVLLMLLHLLAAMLAASVVGREFKERSAYQWLAASGRRWRIALAAKLTLPAALVVVQALLALLLWQTLAPAPLQGSLWLVALALLLSQLAGLSIGLLFCGLLPSLRSTLALLGLLAPLALVMLQHAAAGSPWWSELLPLVHVLRLIERAWWLPPTLGVDWSALRELGVLAVQVAGVTALGGWLLSRRAFLPGMMRQA